MSCRAHRCCRAGALRRPSQQARISLAPRQPHQDDSASCKEDLAALFLRPHSVFRRGPRAHRAAHSRLFCTADREAGKVPVQLHIHAGPSAAAFQAPVVCRLMYWTVWSHRCHTTGPTERSSLRRRCALRVDLQQASATLYMMTQRCGPRQASGPAQLRRPPQPIPQPSLTGAP